MPRGAPFPPSRSLLAPFPRSLLLNRTETLATRTMTDRESSVALCHGVALKKKERDRSRTERAVSLCPRDGVKKERIVRGPRERCRSVPRDGVKKERIGRGPRERCRSVPQGGVKKKKKREREVGRGPREQYRSVPRGGVKKEKREKKNDRSWTEREVYRYPSIRFK